MPLHHGNIIDTIALKISYVINVGRSEGKRWCQQISPCILLDKKNPMAIPSARETGKTNIQLSQPLCKRQATEKFVGGV